MLCTVYLYMYSRQFAYIGFIRINSNIFIILIIALKPVHYLKTR